MKIRKQILKKLKKAYESGMLAPGYPYTLHRRGWPDRKKPGYSHVVCRVCDGYGCTLNSYTNYPEDSKFVKCICELSGKGTAYTSKSYKNKTSLKRRFYFKDAGDLPDFITIDESFRGSDGVICIHYRTNVPDMSATMFRRIQQYKNKKTFLVYIQ